MIKGIYRYDRHNTELAENIKNANDEYRMMKNDDKRKIGARNFMTTLHHQCGVAI